MEAIMTIISLVMLFAAPITQIKLSRLRLKGQTKLPLVIIGFLTVIVGAILPIAVMFLLPDPPPNPSGHFQCGIPPIIFVGVLIVFFFVPLISAIFGSIYYLGHRKPFEDNTSGTSSAKA